MLMSVENSKPLFPHPYLQRLGVSVPCHSHRIDKLPTTDKEKAKLFSKVYREAKEKGVLECPHYRSLFIDEVLENIEKSNVIQQNMS